MMTRGEHNVAPPALPLERVGMFVLNLLVAALLFLFAFLLLVGGIVSPLGIGASSPETRFGIELVVVPFAAIVGVLLRHRFGWTATLHSTRVPRHYLPLLAAAALVGLGSYLVWSWNLHWSLHESGVEMLPLQVLRGVGTVLAAGVTFVGTTLYPRVFATLAGAVAGAILFGIIALIGLAASADFEPFLEDPGGLGLVLLILGPALVSCVLVGASVWLRVQNPSSTPWTDSTPSVDSPPALTVASTAWIAGLMLTLSAVGLPIRTILGNYISA